MAGRPGLRPHPPLTPIPCVLSWIGNRIVAPHPPGCLVGGEAEAEALARSREMKLSEMQRLASGAKRWVRGPGPWRAGTSPLKGSCRLTTSLRQPPDNFPTPPDSSPPPDSFPGGGGK